MLNKILVTKMALVTNMREYGKIRSFMETGGILWKKRSLYKIQKMSATMVDIFDISTLETLDTIDFSKHMCYNTTIGTSLCTITVYAYTRTPNGLLLKSPALF